MNEDILSLGQGPTSIEVDIMEPIDKNKTPRVHSPSLNHIGLWVDDIRKAERELSEIGVRITAGGIRKGAGQIFV